MWYSIRSIVWFKNGYRTKGLQSWIHLNNKNLKCIPTTIFEICITIFWSKIQIVWNLIQDQTNYIRNKEMQLNFGIILMALLFCCVNSCPGSRRRPGMYTAMLDTKYILKSQNRSMFRYYLFESRFKWLESEWKRVGNRQCYSSP